MKHFNRARLRIIAVLLSVASALATGAEPAAAQCEVRVGKRKFEGAERTIVTMENKKILVEIAPELEGRLIRYVDKSRPATPLEWLDDCPYHYAGRWEGKPFTYRIDAQQPDRAAVTVMGGGKLAVGLLHKLGIDVAAPLDLNVERTMSIDPDTTRLHILVKITNTGDGVAPKLRYMVHSVFGQIPALESGDRAFWFLPTPQGVEFFNDMRGRREMGIAAGGAPVAHAFSRFIRGQQADKPRYEAGGWGAVLTSAGPCFIYYDPAGFDFMQYWFGGDASWHFTFEPHTKPVDLKPGESTTTEFTLAYDSADVPFNTSTVAYEQPQVTEIATPDSTINIKSRATTVAASRQAQAKISLEIKDPSGRPILTQDVVGDLKPFVFVDLDAHAKLPADAPLGKYTWTAKLDGGKILGTGKIEVLSPDAVERRKTDAAIASVKTEYDLKLRKLDKELTDARKAALRWNDGMNLALLLEDRNLWPIMPAKPVAVSVRRGAVAVEGMWKANEAIRLNTLAATSPATTSRSTLSIDPDKLLAPLGKDRPLVRDVAVGPDGKHVAALLVDPVKNRVEVAYWEAAGGTVRRFGRYAEKPGENDDTLGTSARCLVFDAQGSIWVGSNAWGQTSRYAVNQDGAPFEESILGIKGALKKFSSEGKPLGAISLLDAPMDLLPAIADGQSVLLATYRHVSAYYGAQVKEGVMVIQPAEIKRLAEIKIPAGSVAVDLQGRLWSADVAGHVAAFDLRGRKLLDVAGTAPAAVLDAKLPPGSPLPVVLRPAQQGGVWALSTLKKNLSLISRGGKTVEPKISSLEGALWKLLLAGETPLVLGDKVLAAP